MNSHLNKLFSLTVNRLRADPIHRIQWILFLLLVIGSVYRISYIIDYNPMMHIWSDPQRHWEQGIDVLRDDPMALTDPVMYQLYISVLAKLTYRDYALTAYYTILLALLAPWAWYRFFRELQPSKTVALSGWVVITWLPSWLSIYAYYMQETLMLPLMGLALWFTWRCLRKQTVNAYLLMVLFWILAGLTRGICIPMAAMAAIWLWWIQDNKIVKGLLATAVLALFLAPLTYRSIQKMQLVSPYGIGLMNQIYALSGKKEIRIHFERQGAVWGYIYGSPATGSEPLQPFSDWHTRRDGFVQVTIDVDEGMKDWRAALAKFDLTLNEYWWLTGENLLLLFFDPSWPDSNKAYPLGNINYHLRWLWLPLGIIVVIASVVFYRRSKAICADNQLLLPAIFIAWFVVQGFLLIAVNEGRYRKPYEGMVIAQLIFLVGNWRRRPQATAVEFYRDGPLHV